MKESAFARKDELLQEVDFKDVLARPEGLKGCSGAAMVQLPLQPAYGLTVHKVQALTIAHIVRGCLEGVFAFGLGVLLLSRKSFCRRSGEPCTAQVLAETA